MASENIAHILAWRDMFIRDANMVKEPPGKGGAYPMIADKGAGWVAWQDVWLDGLRGLCDQDVYIISHSRAFFEKFQSRSSEDWNKKMFFDPTYALPDGDAPALCILDWERKQIQQYEEENSLQRCHLQHCLEEDKSDPNNQEEPPWYCDNPKPIDFSEWRRNKTGSGKHEVEVWYPDSTAPDPWECLIYVFPESEGMEEPSPPFEATEQEWPLGIAARVQSANGTWTNCTVTAHSEGCIRVELDGGKTKAIPHGPAMSTWLVKDPVATRTAIKAARVLWHIGCRAHVKRSDGTWSECTIRGFRTDCIEVDFEGGKRKIVPIGASTAEWLECIA